MNKRSIFALPLLLLPMLAFGQLQFGNPKGAITLVEYVDYNCPVCRAFMPTVFAFAKTHPNLNVIERVVPVLAPTSPVIDSAILATFFQHKFNAVQRDVLSLHLRETIDYPHLVALLHSEKINMRQLNNDMQRPEITKQLSENKRLYEKLKVNQIPVIQLYRTDAPRIKMTLVGAQSTEILQRVVRSL